MPRVSFMSKKGPVSFIARTGRKKKQNKKNIYKKKKITKGQGKKPKIPSEAWYEKHYLQQYMSGALPKKRKPYLRYTNPAYSPWATNNPNKDKAIQDYIADQIQAYKNDFEERNATWGQVERQPYKKLEIGKDGWPVSNEPWPWDEKPAPVNPPKKEEKAPDPIPYEAEWGSGFI